MSALRNPHHQSGRGHRSLKPEVRNPLLQLRSAARIRALPPDTRMALAELLHELSLDARERAERSWRQHKAPMAAYWKAVSVYAAHLRRLIRPTSVQRAHQAVTDRSPPPSLPPAEDST